MPAVTNLAEIGVMLVTQSLVLLEPFAVERRLLSREFRFSVAASDYQMVPFLQTLQEREELLKAEEPFATPANTELHLKVPLHFL